MKRRLLVLFCALILTLSPVTAFAATSSGKSSIPAAPSRSSSATAPSPSTPSTSVRSGSFSSTPKSTAPDSSAHSTSEPSQAPSSGFSGGASNKPQPNVDSSSSSKTVGPDAGGASSSSSGFSGGASNKTTVPSSPSSNSSVTKNGSSYSTGFQRPSNVQDGSKMDPSTGRTYYAGSTYYNNLPPNQKTGSSFWPVVGAFAAGTFLGSMLHPTGGYYPAAGGGYVHQPFSFLSLLLDLFITAFVIWLAVMVYKSWRGRRV